MSAFHAPLAGASPGKWSSSPVLTLLGLLCAGAVPMLLAAGSAAAPPATIYANLTVIDGTGAPAAKEMAIVVEGDRIAAVLPMASLAGRPFPGAVQVDLTGKFALPGLIDTHEHLGTAPNRRIAEANLRRCLYGGITAVRDMAGDARFLADLARGARLAEIPAPDIFYSALMAGPGFFVDPRTHQAAQGAVPGRVPWLQAVTPATDMPMAVALARGTGAAGIKIYADLAPAEVRRIVAEAHQQGIPVWCHASIFPTTPAEAVEAGVDSVSHAYLLGYLLVEPRPASYSTKSPIDARLIRSDSGILSALFAEMRRKGVILDATVSVYAEADRKAGKKSAGMGPIAAQLTAAAYRAGVSISTGTDHAAAADSPYPSLQQEMEMLVSQSGMSPADVIHSATEVGARALRAEGQMGTIATGKLANLVVVSRNPLADITALRDVVLTIKRGRAYPRSDYRQPPPEDLDGFW